MPGGDRTGPTGAGPMTGRGAGLCGGAATPGSMNFGFGRGGGGGRGRGGAGGGGGRGWRNMFRATGLTGWQRAAAADPAVQPAYAAQVQDPVQEAIAEQELQMLKRQADSAAAQLEQVKRRIEELSGKTARTEER